jgi:hypothetical protein
MIKLKTLLRPDVPSLQTCIFYIRWFFLLPRTLLRKFLWEHQYHKIQDLTSEIHTLNAHLKVMHGRLLQANYINPSLLYRVLEPLSGSSKMVDWQQLIIDHFKQLEEKRGPQEITIP